MTKLSVNINKIATLRNARGGNNPNLITFTQDCERFGAQGITVHPRPDERHIRYNDMLPLSSVIKTEFNIEGYPNKRFMKLIALIKPTQATLVPDTPDILTSNTGWDTLKHYDFLKDVISTIQSMGIRTSIFVNPHPRIIEEAARIGTNRIELFTGFYALGYKGNQKKAIEPYLQSALIAHRIGLELNAGHDLNLTNLNFFSKNIPNITEISIGHALICDALYMGLENAIQLYLRQLTKSE